MLNLMTKFGHDRRVGTLAPDLDLRGAALVSMMQPAQHWCRDDPARLRRLDRPGLRGIFLQCQVNAVPMIIFHECLEVPVQTSLVEHDQVTRHSRRIVPMSRFT